MKIKSGFHILVLFTAILVFSVPFIAHAQVFPYAQDPELVQAAFDARQDAEAVFNHNLWYFAGCFFNFAGYFVSKTYYSPVPAIALLGHPPNYIAVYTDTYRARMTELRSTAALNGCIHAGLVQVFLPICVLAVTNR